MYKMNPTLAQLAHEAGITVTAESEKFAELIVRECAGICHKMAEDSDSYVVHDGDTCAEQIKKHFGVEE